MGYTSCGLYWPDVLNIWSLHQLPGQECGVAAIEDMILNQKKCQEQLPLIACIIDRLMRAELLQAV